MLHLSNSAATLTNPKSHFDLVRLGISMYGLSPDVEAMGDSKRLCF
ncbi:MAG: alanine racemase [Actinomycetota bacterium]